MIKTLLLSICLLGCFIDSFPQSKHMNSGVIDFEKKVNAYALIGKLSNFQNDELIGEAIKDYKQSHPQFITMKSQLSFNQNQSLYIPIDNGSEKDNLWNGQLIDQQYNKVYLDLEEKKSLVQKKVFNSNYLLTDSLPKFKWKFTGETREIAGFDCYRVNGTYLDSIYVIAFYTQEIEVSSGPERFSGLPGMILGVVMPHDNITWFATKVEFKEISDIKVAFEGKQTSYTWIISLLKDFFKKSGSKGTSLFRLMTL